MALTWVGETVKGPCASEFLSLGVGVGPELPRKWLLILLPGLNVSEGDMYQNLGWGAIVSKCLRHCRKMGT